MTVFDPTIRWRQLPPGLLTIAALLAGALLVLTQLRVGQLTGKMFTMYALATEARGILKGSAVWLSGQRVGVVKEVTFHTSDGVAKDGILLQLSILDKHRELVRRDSRAEVKRGAKLIGNPVLHLSVGSAAFPALAEGDTITTSPQFDTEQWITRVDEVSTMLPVLLADLNTIGTSATRLDTILRSFLAAGNPNSVASLAGALIDDFTAVANQFSDGTVGMLATDSLLHNRMRSVRAASDSLIIRYGARGTIGTNIIDQALLTRLENVTQQLRATSGAVSARFADYSSGDRSRALSAALDRLAATLRALRSDAKSHPFKYMIF